MARRSRVCNSLRRISLTLAASFAFLSGLIQAEGMREPMPGSNSRLHSSASLCVFFTANTDKTLDYLSGMSNSVAGALGAMSGFDSRRMGADLNAALQARFRDVVPIKALDERSSRGCALVLSLDIKVVLSPGIRKTGVAEIKADFADSHGQRVDGMSVLAEKSTWNAIGEAAADAWAAALADFGSKMDRSAPLLAFAAGSQNQLAASAASVPPGDASMLVDLAFWDSVKASANPADFQAYLQKFPDGTFVSLARTRLSALGEAAPARPTPAPPVDRKFNFGTYHALVIGNDKYRSVTPLKTAVKDARTVATVLQREYGFKVSLLVDATRNQMLDAFDEMRRTLTDRDNLLIYYAGHGHLDGDSDRGFWLPVDAEANRRANWLSNSDLADVARATRAKHVLVVADSCYAGTLTRSLAVQMTALDDMSRLAQKRARTALVSGGMEPVEDSGGGGHSIFAKAFIDSLLANTGVTDMSRMFSAMRRQVILGAQQTPQYGDIRQTGHEGGDFIFVRRK